MNKDAKWKDNYHQNPHILHIGTTPPHSYIIPFHNKESAFENIRENSLYFTSLCGDWSFRYYSSITDLASVTAHDGLPAETIPVPMSWQMFLDRGYDKPAYRDTDYPFPVDPPYVPSKNPAGFYFRDFTISEELLNTKKLYLVFEGVDSCFYLYINDKFVGYSQVSHSTSEFEINAYLTPGTNTIKVIVLKWCDGSYLEDQDKFRLSGIFREVYILTRDKAHLSDLFVKSEVAKDLKKATVKAEAAFSRDTDFIWLFTSPDGSLLREGKAKTQDRHAIIEADVVSPLLWSDETPHLYTLTIISGTEVITEFIGIRRYEVTGRILYVNGKPIKAKGVNRHDSHPELGAATPEKDFLEDLYIMKANGINTVRTAHYPNDPRFMHYCDKLGLYVILEADLEAHGVDFAEGFGRNSLSDDPQWSDAYVDRARLMLERDKNRASVLLWSIGNESGIGQNHKKMADYLHSALPGCIVHSERFNFIEHLIRNDTPETKGFERYLTEPYIDIDSRMYATPEDCLKNYVNNPKATRPFFLCEYCHAMGNSPGDLTAYWDLIYENDCFLGACVWEFTDHAVNAGTRDNPQYLYGGDFGEKLHDGNFCMDGLVYPDRRLHTGLLEYKQILAPVKIESYDENTCLLTVKNRRYFTDLSDISLYYTVEDKGKLIKEGVIPALETAPQSTTSYRLDLASLPQISQNTYLTLFFRTNKNSPWSNAGHEVSVEQIKLTANTTVITQHKKTTISLDFSEDTQNITVRDGDFTYKFNRHTGELVSLKADNTEMLSSPVSFNLWRAPTDNDRIIRLAWQKAGYDRMECDCTCCKANVIDGSAVEITSNYRVGAEALPVLADMTLTCRIVSGKGIALKYDFVRRSEREPHIPRLGIQFTMPKEFSSFKFFGKGPMEAYSDKQLAARMGLFEFKVCDHFEHYLKPQENMAHADTEWLEMAGNKYTLAVCGGENTPSFSFNCSNFSPMQLTNTRHDFELIPLEDTVVNVDFAQSGIGSNSCGPALAKEYTLCAPEYHYSFKLKPIKN